MLQELFQGSRIQEIRGASNVTITGITQDSRRVEKGFLFVAIPGSRRDGSAFIPQAVERGASAVVTSTYQPAVSITQIMADDPRRVLAEAAARFYGNPSRKLTVIGVTGTNGKTTLTYLLESILKAAGRKPAVIGTIGHRFGGDFEPADNTTPESVDLQRLLSKFLKAGATDVIMEVSSHALAMGRVEGIHFDAGVFTNLTQDHLDFHADMDDYFQSKLKLFDDCLPRSAKTRKVAVINTDDLRGKSAANASERHQDAVTVVRTGVRDGDVRCLFFQVTEDGIAATIAAGKTSFEIRSPLVGHFNLENLLCAVGTAWGLGISAEAIAEGAAALSNVPGRLEKIPNGRGIHAFVDYAHSPDALARVGETLRGVKKDGQKMITVFGCGGDRDRIKRPLMGANAADFSDLIIVTSDNPRTEDPEKILDEIISGIASDHPEFLKDRLLRIVDRKEAIERAVSLARPGDILLVAGKGHEHYQIIGIQKFPFSDQDILRRVLL